MGVDASLHTAQHIRTDGRIVYVAADFAATQIPEQWQRKCIAHCVNVYICRNERESFFK